MRKAAIAIVIVIMLITVVPGCSSQKESDESMPLEFGASAPDGVLIGLDVPGQDWRSSASLAAPPARVFLGDPRAATAREGSFPSGIEGSMEYPWIPRSGGVVFIEGVRAERADGGSAVFVSSDMVQRVDLGHAVELFPGVERDVVWLFRKDGTLLAVDLTGRPRTPVYVVPRGRNVIGVVSEGVVTTRPSDQMGIEIWNPASGTVVRQLEGTGAVGSVPSNYVADIDRGPCAQRCARMLRPVDGGQPLQFMPDEGQAWIAAGISPDGAKYGLIQRPANAGELGVDDHVESTVVVFELPTGKEVSRYTARTWPGKLSLQWSPSSDWVYYGQDSTHMATFRFDDPQRTVRQFPMGAVGTFVVTDAM